MGTFFSINNNIRWSTKIKFQFNQLLENNLTATNLILLKQTSIEEELLKCLQVGEFVKMCIAIRTKLMEKHLHQNLHDI
jgi:hypothetical protein